jgi:hypothetical protein
MIKNAFLTLGAGLTCLCHRKRCGLLDDRERREFLELISVRLLAVLLLCFFASVYAQEDCVFDDNAYIQFINDYSQSNTSAKIEPDGRTLIVKRNGEVIKVEGGGCVHLGVAIELNSQQSYTEEQFLQKTLDLAIEFGDWLINTGKLKESISKGNYQVIDGIYFFQVDIMTVFDASYDEQGKINVDFYIN